MRSDVVEYDCWFQRHELPRAETGDILGRVCAGEESPVVENAVREYCFLMRKCFGVEVSRAGEGDRNAVHIGTAAYLSAQLGEEFPAVGADGFLLRASASRVVVAGESPAGALYGVYRLIMRLSLGRVRLEDGAADYVSAPVAAFRVINHWDNVDGTIERGYAGGSIFFKDGKLNYSEERIWDYARLLASVGINRISVNNANVRAGAKWLVADESLPAVSRLAALFRPFGIRLLLSVNFAAPMSVGGLPSADPLNSEVGAWWKERADAIYRSIPDFGGFVVKADSEGEAGPFQYNRTHADGANMLARALAPHGGSLVWRCFVYNCTQDWRDQKTDRARAAYDHFMPLDGAFDDNVLLQIKHGPYDFQVREPVSPLFGALKKTRHLMELQVTQEYTGQQIDLCFLPSMWEWVMDFDLGRSTEEKLRGLFSRPAESGLEGFAAISNVGLNENWTGHTLAQANLFGYGQLAWNPARKADEIAREWAGLTFSGQEAREAVTEMLLSSYATYEKYNTPFGNCFMVNPHVHYGPSPEGYEFSSWGTYHRADRSAIGVDRTPGGTGYVEQYPAKTAALFTDKKTCPENLLLFFHRVPYNYVMRNGKTLLQNIYDNHFEGCARAEAMLDAWKTLEDKLGEDVYRSVLARLERQVKNAREWRDVVNTYFYRKTGIADEKGRKIYG